MTKSEITGCNAQRADNALLGPGSDIVGVDFHGRTLMARRGESLLATLIASGEYRLRETSNGEFRGPFCGMGVCQECLVEVDGAPAQRACMTKVDHAMTVRRQGPQVKTASGIPLNHAPSQTPGISVLTPQIAVIGGGPGGMSAAAAAANAGADVVLIDERPQLGGQFYKQPLEANDLQLSDFDDLQFSAGRQLIGELERSGAQIMQSAKVIGVYEPLDLVVSATNGTQLIRPQILIVATGAYEICHPFAGWTLPGVMTTGAAQTLLRSNRVLPGRRVLVAGNGPLNFQVAAELAGSGAEVVAVIEAAEKPALASLGSIVKMITSDPLLTFKGARYLSDLKRQRTSLVYGHRITRVQDTGTEDTPGLKATVQSASPNEPNAFQFEVDAICLGYGFRASNEILRALGCRHNVSSQTGALEAIRDQDCLTSRPDVFAIGDCTRLGGAPAAQTEGRAAALAAIARLGLQVPAGKSKQVAKLQLEVRRNARFQRALWTLFESIVDLPDQIDNDAIICRCENLTLAQLKQVMGNVGQESMASIKRATRAGMGRCQGRYCGPAIARMLTAANGRPVEESGLWAPRPPIKPIRIAELASLDFPDD